MLTFLVVTVNVTVFVYIGVGPGRHLYILVPMHLILSIDDICAIQMLGIMLGDLVFHQGIWSDPTGFYLKIQICNYDCIA